MPELPEVETVRRGLERLIVNRRLASVEVLSEKSFAVAPGCAVATDLLGAQVTNVRRRGKVVIIDLAREEGGDSAATNTSTISVSSAASTTLSASADQDTTVAEPTSPNSAATSSAPSDTTRLETPTVGPDTTAAPASAVDHPCLVVHLKMTGQLVFQGTDQHWGAGHPTDSLVDALPDRSTRVIIGFDDGSTLFFNDQRKFGWIQLMPASAVGQLELLATMGPEPLTGDPWPEFLSRVRRHPGTTIKAAILNQSVVAGIGNIYADEALWAASVHPSTPVRDLDDQALHAILDGAREAMETSIAHGGSTDRNYVDAEGKRGSYLTFAHVFRRQGQPCPRCSQLIIKTRVAGRGTHLCPDCQRLG